MLCLWRYYFSCCQLTLLGFNTRKSLKENGRQEEAERTYSILSVCFPMRLATEMVLHPCNGCKLTPSVFFFFFCTSINRTFLYMGKRLYIYIYMMEVDKPPDLHSESWRPKKAHVWVPTWVQRTDTQEIQGCSWDSWCFNLSLKAEKD